MHCAKCDAELPQDALFCVECGASVVPAATGPTVRIAQPTGPRCAACGTVSPARATFCVTCGRNLGQPVQEVPYKPSLAMPQSMTQMPMQPASPMLAMPSMPAQQRRHRSSGATNGIAGVVFMFGLALLFFTGTIWPGILLLVGITSCIERAGRGKQRESLQVLVWMVGMTVLLTTGHIWPGVLVLVGISALLNGKHGFSSCG